MRHPATLCESLDSEFVDMLKFAQKRQYAKRFDYKIIRKGLSSIKERYRLGTTLEWFQPDLPA
jgi:hypothetical protein